MCVLVLAVEDHPRFDLVVAANRDEFHDRPAAAAGPWSEAPALYAGRDLEAGGTWLGVDRSGRFAAVTNLRSGHRASGALSRGALVRDYLREPLLDPAAYAARLAPLAPRFAGVNLLAFDRDAGIAWTNHGPRSHAVARGVYGLSNGAFDEPWPKTDILKAGYRALRTIEEPHRLTSALLSLLCDRKLPEDDALPDTGVGLEYERLLAPVFIRGAGYGTRCSSVVLRERGRSLWFAERRFDADGRTTGESRFDFAL